MREPFGLTARPDRDQVWSRCVPSLVGLAELSTAVRWAHSREPQEPDKNEGGQKDQPEKDRQRTPVTLGMRMAGNTRPQAPAPLRLLGAGELDPLCRGWGASRFIIRSQGGQSRIKHRVFVTSPSGID